MMLVSNSNVNKVVVFGIVLMFIKLMVINVVSERISRFEIMV